MKQVDKFCQDHVWQFGDNYRLPSSEDEKQLLYRHLLYDDTRRAMFCFVEKIGMTCNKQDLIHVHVCTMSYHSNY